MKSYFDDLIFVYDFEILFVKWKMKVKDVPPKSGGAKIYLNILSLQLSIKLFWSDQALTKSN